MLAVEELVPGYDETPVCPAVTFGLNTGESIAIAGSNGAGKSTLARTIAGQLSPLHGRALFDGAPVDERSAQFRGEVAAVFDDDAFFPALTVREHLLITARGHAVPQPDDAVQRELDFFGIGSHAEVFPDSLSSGQRRRLLLASAFVRPCRMLLLDEPEQRLDTAMRRQLAERLRDCTSSGTAVLLVTHDPQLLTVAADRCVLLGGDDVAYLRPERAAAAITP